MLRSVKSLVNLHVKATDGAVGAARDFYFDDASWTLRYLLVDAGHLLAGKHVLVSPASIEKTDWATRSLSLKTDAAHLLASPGIDLAKPISRDYEEEYSEHHGIPPYWEDPAGVPARMVGALTGVAPRTEAVAAIESAATARTRDPHLRSALEIDGYHIKGTDAEIGHIADFIVDDSTWSIRYLVIDTANWWFGKKVLVAPHWTDEINWREKRVYLDLTRAMIQGSPEWKPDAPVNREYEGQLYDYYGRPVYWKKDAGAKVAAALRPAGVDERTQTQR